MTVLLRGDLTDFITNFLSIPYFLPHYLKEYTFILLRCIAIFKNPLPAFSMAYILDRFPCAYAKIFKSCRRLIISSKYQLIL
jgi:hypothetical protein